MVKTIVSGEYFPLNQSSDTPNLRFPLCFHGQSQIPCKESNSQLVNVDNPIDSKRLKATKGLLFYPSSWSTHFKIANVHEKSQFFLVKSPFSYGFHMDFRWFSYGFPMASQEESSALPEKVTRHCSPRLMAVSRIYFGPIFQGYVRGYIQIYLGLPTPKRQIGLHRQIGRQIDRQVDR